MEEQVHAGDAQHGVVEVEAVEEGAVEVIAPLLVEEEIRMKFAEIFTGGDEEAGGADGRIADDVGGLGSGELDHEPDDMAGRAELTVLAGAAILPSMYS